MSENEPEKRKLICSNQPKVQPLEVRSEDVEEFVVKPEPVDQIQNGNQAPNMQRARGPLTSQSELSPSKETCYGFCDWTVYGSRNQ